MLATRYSKAGPESPQFPKETLLALEYLVLDETAPSPESGSREAHLFFEFLK